APGAGYAERPVDPEEQAMTTTGIDATTTARQLVDLSQSVIDAALKRGTAVTAGGRNIDDFQVHTERLAYLATQARAAQELLAYVERLAAAGKPNAAQESMALIYAAEVTHALRSQIEV